LLRRPRSGGMAWHRSGKYSEDDADEAWMNQKFSHWFSRACRAAGLPVGIAAHGVRKRAACDDALKQWPAKKLMAKYGWSDISEVERYTRMAEMELSMAEEAKLAAD
jgi:hypothetical protein